MFPSSSVRRFGQWSPANSIRASIGSGPCVNIDNSRKSGHRRMSVSHSLLNTGSISVIQKLNEAPELKLNELSHLGSYQNTRWRKMQVRSVTRNFRGSQSRITVRSVGGKVISCTMTVVDEAKDLHGSGHPEATHQIRPRSISVENIYREGNDHLNDHVHHVRRKRGKGTYDRLSTSQMSSSQG